MISSLLGELQQKEDNALVVAVGGVGFRVAVPKGLAERLNIGEKVFLHTHLIVHENDLSLYGFEFAEDRKLFTTLLGVDGVGPKVALSVLSTLTIDAIQRAIFSDEPELSEPRPRRGEEDRAKNGALPERPSQTR